MQYTTQKRKHLRLKHRAKVDLTDMAGQAETLFTRDFSDGGIYFYCEHENPPEIGKILGILILDIEDAQVQKARVVRVEPGSGFAVVFV